MEHALAFSDDLAVNFPVEPMPSWRGGYGNAHRCMIPATGTNRQFGLLGYLDDYRLPTGSVFAIEIFRSPRLEIARSLGRAFVSIVEHNEPESDWTSEVQAIRDAFALNLSDLAVLFEVSRPTLYGWLGGKSVPKRNKQKRIAALSEIAECWKAAKLGSMQKYWNAPESGQFAELQRLLTAQQLQITVVKELVERLRRSTRLLPPRRSRPIAVEGRDSDKRTYRGGGLVRHADPPSD